ncbi:MAG TPA: hypothetical protein VE621_18085 [Bryobacteraceae bacterium]|nr:hypothetical protein [Bryobacteraceae bacterium]
MEIPTAFIGCGGEKWTCIAAIIERVSASLWPIALGLAIGLCSRCVYLYFATRLAGVDAEMDAAILDLTNQLAGRRAWTFRHEYGALEAPSLFAQFSAPRADNTRPYQAMLRAGTIALIAICLRIAEHVYFDFRPLVTASWTGAVEVLLAFLVSTFPARTFARRLTHHPRDGAVLLASAFCLCWTVVGLAVRAVGR